MLLRIFPRESCPKEIKEELLASRHAPKSFIDWHRDRAETELTAICSHSGAQVHNQWMQRDGWFDGFEALHAIIETQKNRLLKIKWQEGQQCFMRQAPNSSAWMTMRPEEMDCQSFSDIMHATRDDSKNEVSQNDV